MFVKKIYSKKNNKLISYRLKQSGKDSLTGKQKYYTKTWKIPKSLSLKRDIEKELREVMVQFEKQCEIESKGLKEKEKYITFETFANEWHKRILINNKEAINYYEKVKESLKVINPILGKYILKDITPTLITTFIDYVRNRKYVKEVVIVKSSLKKLLSCTNKKLYEIATDIGISTATLRNCLKIGQTISLTTAKSLCNYFDVKLDSFFEIHREEKKYAKESNDGIKRTLSAILAEAKRSLLIADNYASSDFIRPEKGEKKEKQILSLEETKRFVNLISKEPRLAKRIVLLLSSIYGLRREEISPLTWNDFDFNNKTFSINKAYVYNNKTSKTLKSTKSVSSNRTLSMCNILIDTLKAYKEYWDSIPAIQLGIWGDVNHLFINENTGELLLPKTLGDWVKQYVKSNNFTHISLHTLRHGVASHLIAIGTSPNVAAKLLGHSNEKITLDIYCHTNTNQTDYAIKNFSNQLLQQSSN